MIKLSRPRNIQITESAFSSLLLSLLSHLIVHFKFVTYTCISCKCHTLYIYVTNQIFHKNNSICWVLDNSDFNMEALELHNNYFFTKFIFLLPISPSCILSPACCRLENHRSVCLSVHLPSSDRDTVVFAWFVAQTKTFSLHPSPLTLMCIRRSRPG